MAFVDTLKQPGDNERIAATCEAYVELLHSRIRHAAQNAAQFGHNSVSGYLNSDHLTGIKEEEKTELGCPVGEGNPFDFKKVFMDTNCNCYNSHDTLYLDQDMVEKRVLKKVDVLLEKDGFKRHVLRCDKIQGYSNNKKRGIFKDRYNRHYTGEYFLYVHIDLAW